MNATVCDLNHKQREWKLSLKWKAMYMVPVLTLPLAEKAGRLCSDFSRY